jgi:hypothetical protein
MAMEKDLAVPFRNTQAFLVVIMGWTTAFIAI